MNSKRGALVILFVAIAIAASVLGYRLVVLQGTPLFQLEIIAIAVPPLVFLTFLPFLLRPVLLGPTKRESQTRTTAKRIRMIGLMVLFNALLFGGLLFHRPWLMIVGALVIALESMLGGSKREKGMQPGQFSLRRLFVTVTFCAVIIGIMLAIERWHQNAQLENNEHWLQRTREINEEWLQRSRAIWENAREKLPAGVYQQKMKELDDEAEKKAKELNEEAAKRGLK
jgi:hypothetical protein